MSGILRQGFLGLEKKKGVEERYFVLRGDRLEYYKNKEEVDRSSKPSKSFDVFEIDVSQGAEAGTFVIGVGSSASTLHETVEGDADEWFDALRAAIGAYAEEADEEEEVEDEEWEEEVVEEEEPEAPTRSSREARSDGESETRQGRGRTWTAIPAEDEKVERGEDEEVQEAAVKPSVDGPGRRTVEAARGFLSNVVNKARGRTWRAVPSDDEKVAPASPRADDREVLCEGPLSIVMKKGSRKQKHCVLFEDGLDYWSSAQDRADGREASASLESSMVDDFRELDGGFELRLVGEKSRPLELYIVASEHRHMWLDGLRRWLHKQDTAPKAVDIASPISSEPQFIGKKVTQALRQGTFLVNRGGSVLAQYFALFPDRLLCWQNQASFEAGGASEEVLNLADVVDIEVLDNGLDITTRGDHALKLLGPTGAELDAWADSFSSALGVEATTSTQEDPWHHKTPQESTSAPSKPRAARSRQDAKVRCLHKGQLEVGHRAGRMERMFAVLYTNRLDEYRSEIDFKSGRVEPMCSTRLSDIAELRVAGATFDLTLRDNSLRRLRETSKDELASWLAYWGEALSTPEFDCRASGRRWIHVQDAHAEQPMAEAPEQEEQAAEAQEGSLELWTPTPAVASRASPTDVEDLPVRKTAVTLGESKFLKKEGLLAFAGEGGLVWKYCILQEDRLEAWSDIGAWAEQRPPETTVDFSQADKGGLQVQSVGNGIVLTCGGRKIGLHLGARGDVEGWVEAFNVVFNLRKQSGPAASADLRGMRTPPVHRPLAGSPLTSSPTYGGAVGSRARPASAPRPGQSASRSRSAEPRGGPGWVPRCAQPRRQSQVEACRQWRPTTGQVQTWADLRLADYQMSIRRPAPRSDAASVNESLHESQFTVNTHGGGYQGQEILHGALAKVTCGKLHSSRRPPGSDPSDKGAVQRRDESAPLRGVPLKQIPGKVTDSGFSTSRCMSARPEVTSKINDSACRIANPFPGAGTQERLGANVTGKVTARSGSEPSLLSSTRKGDLRGKITDAGRGNLGDQLAMRKHAAIAEPQGKVNESMRLANRGWATSTPRVANMDRHMPLGEKSASLAQRPRGGSPHSGLSAPNAGTMRSF